MIGLPDNRFLGIENGPGGVGTIRAEGTVALFDRRTRAGQPREPEPGERRPRRL